MFNTTRFDYTPPKSLAGFFRSDARYRFIRGPIGSTKSTACTMELFRRMCQQKPDDDGIRRTKFALIRNTLQQIRETQLTTIRKTLGPMLRYKVSESKLVFRFNDIESEWLMLPLDSPENIQKLLSLELTGAWVSEFREIEPEIVKNVFSRCGRYPSEVGIGEMATWYGVIAETNSFSEDSPWFELLEVEKPEVWDYFVQPGAYDEGADWLQYLVPTYYDDLVESNGKAWVDQYVHNRIGPSLSSQAVFAKAFDSHEHVSKKPLLFIPNVNLVLGIDVARNPAAVAGQIDPRGRLNVLGSLWAENVGIETFLNNHLKPWLAESFPRAYIYAVVDPASMAKSQVGETSVMDVIKKAGLSAFPATTNQISPRLRAVENYMNMRNGFLIDKKSNEDLIMALQHKYRFKRNKEKALAEIPDKSHPWSDLADALQYLCLGIESRAMARQLAAQNTDWWEPEPAVGAWT